MRKHLYFGIAVGSVLLSAAMALPAFGGHP